MYMPHSTVCFVVVCNLFDNIMRYYLFRYLFKLIDHITYDDGREPNRTQEKNDEGKKMYLK